MSATIIIIPTERMWRHMKNTSWTPYITGCTRAVERSFR